MRSRRRARTLVAVGETLAAILLAGLAWWCWHHGVIVTVRQGLQLSRIDGRWWAAATGAGTLAGILLLDACRYAVPAAVLGASASSTRGAPQEHV